MKLGKLKDKKKAIYLTGTILFIGLVGGSLYFAQKEGSNNDTSKDGLGQVEQSEEEIQQNLAEKEKQALDNQTESTTTIPPQSEEAVIANGVLVDVSITAINDGTNIYLSLYGPAGNYDVEKCFTYVNTQCISGWTKKVANQYYVGHGGLAIDTWTTSEITATYRIHKLTSGTIVATSKNIIIDRNFSGTKTFTGE